MEFNYIVAVLVTSLICQSRGSMCISNCLPNCDSYIPHGNLAGCLGGRTSSYECDQGYEKTTGTLTCQDGLLKPMDIDLLGSEKPLCKPKSCPDEIPNGALSNSCVAKVGFNCEYTCNFGFMRLRNVTTIECETKADWNPNPHLLCTNPYFQCPYEIPGADLDLSCRRHPGDKCRYTCREGYVHSHYREAYCSRPMDWGQPMDSFCIQIKCPPFLEHSLIEYPCTGKYGEICGSYKCHAPYIKPPLPPNLKCNASRTLDYTDTTGYWEWDKDMGHPCVREEDFCPSTFRNGRISSDCHLQPGAECSYTCDAGCIKYPNTMSKVHCRQSGGRWEEITDLLCNCKHCPDNIANGHIDSLVCKRRSSTNCSFACNYGCRKTVTTLYCNDDGEWSNPSPCICSGKGITVDMENTGSSSSVIIIVIVVIVVVVLLLFGVVCMFRYRRRMNRPATTARANEIHVPTIAPNVLPLDASSPATNNGPNPYSEIQTTPDYTNNNRRQAHSSGYSAVGTSEPTADNESFQRFFGKRADQTSDPAVDIHGAHGCSEYPVSDTLSPPPTYEEVTSDPSRFKTEGLIVTSLL